MSSPLNMCFELNSTIKASNATLHIFKQIGAPPISQNSWGARVQVCLQKIYVMHMTKIITSFQKKRKFGSVRADRSDRSVLAELKNNSSSFQSASH